MRLEKHNRSITRRGAVAMGLVCVRALWRQLLVDACSYRHCFQRGSFEIRFC
jgi:hypothetical protein